MPQPDEQAGRTGPAQPPAPTDEETVGSAETGTTPEPSAPDQALPPADAEPSTEPSAPGQSAASAEPTPTASAGPGEAGPAESAEPATMTYIRWTGSAAVPRSAGKKHRRRFVDTDSTPVPPPPREPTLELPAAERAALEELPPVDPWADHPLPSHGPPPATPPALAYPVPGPAPATAPAARPAVPPRPPAGGQPARTAPPGWSPPPGYPAIRRRRRWPWVLLTVTLLTVGCCCGVPAYLVQPMAEQHPATATLPAQISDLRRHDDAGSKRMIQQLKGEMWKEHPLADDTFAGVYRTDDGKLVTIFGATGFRLSPDKDLDTELAWLTPRFHLADPRSINTNVRGEYVTCGTGRDRGTSLVACTWADHGSIGTALFTRLSVPDSADLLAHLRATIISRG